MSLPTDPTLNHTNQMNILTPFITEVHFSIILPSTPAILKWSLSFIFATKLFPAPHYTILPSFITRNLLKTSNFLQAHYFLSLTPKYAILSSFTFLPLSYTQTIFTSTVHFLCLKLKYSQQYPH